MRSRFLSSNLFRWNKTLREDCSLLFYGWYSAGLRDIFWDSNSTFKYHSFETMMLKWNETRLLDLSCLEFTGPTLKLLASGRRSNVKFKPWMVKRTLVLKCQKQSVNCYLFFFFSSDYAFILPRDSNVRSEADAVLQVDWSASWNKRSCRRSKLWAHPKKSMYYPRQIIHSTHMTWSTNLDCTTLGSGLGFCLGAIQNSQRFKIFFVLEFVGGFVQVPCSRTQVLRLTRPGFELTFFKLPNLDISATT